MWNHARRSCGKVHPASLGAEDVAALLSWLAERRHVSSSTQNQALSAVLFLYRIVLGVDLAGIPPVVRARASERLPVVLSREEVMLVQKHLTARFTSLSLFSTARD